jgi:hypothetical protein
MEKISFVTNPSGKVIPIHLRARVTTSPFQRKIDSFSGDVK